MGRPVSVSTDRTNMRRGLSSMIGPSSFSRQFSFLGSPLFSFRKKFMLMKEMVGLSIVSEWIRFQLIDLGLKEDEG